MSVSFQRLLVILISLIFLITSILLILINSKKNLIFFYTPSELMNANPKINDIVRIGGFVMKESINKIGTNIYNFTITDHKELLYVTYDGVLPDLFREEQGVVVEGKIIKNKHLKAISVFAKHDENYIPASIKSQLKNNEYWKKDYK